MKRGFRKTAALVAIGTVALTGLVAPTTAAQAAPGDLNATVQWVDTTTNQPVTDLTATIDSRSQTNLALVTLRIAYSCGPVDCTNTVLHLDPMQLDPFYGQMRFASYNSGTLPPGATMTGNANLGWDINLGNLTPGSSGSFDLLFNYQSRPVGTSPQSLFPEGAQVAATVTSSATGIDPVSNSSSITWHLATPEGPRVAFTSGDAPTPLPIARVGQPYDYTLFMSAGCLWERSTAGHGEPVYECAESYTVTQTLPAGVQFVSATHGGVYDAGTNTVTWADSGLSAATGWGSLGYNGVPRTVSVVFPEEMFTGECVIDAESTLAVDMAYLSGAQKSATVTRSGEANACAPFADLSFNKTSSRSSGSAAEPIVWEGQNQYWAVEISNRSNVPAVSTITETFDQAGLPVNRIVSTGGAAHMLVTLDDGTIVDTTTTDYRAPAGRNIVSAEVTTPELAGPNKQSDSTPLVNSQLVRFYYTPSPGVPTQGFERTNTAEVTSTFPGTPELDDVDLGTSSQTVFVTQRPPTISPSLGASVVGGGNPAPGTVVNFTMHGVTKDMNTDVPFEPQYVYVAPFGWDIIPDSAVLAGAPDAVYEYKTVVINGETRQAVYAHRPAGTVWGVNETTPAMTVQATPTTALAANTISTSTFYLGDAAHNYSRASAIWGSNRIDDTPDLDGDGVTTETFTYTSVNHRIGASSGLSLLKEICSPDATQADGCDWQSNPDVPVKVSPDTDDIIYRVTIKNSGTTPLSNVVGYDVLPYPGDTGVTPGAGPRGSTFTEKVASIPASSGVELAFSESTNPCRPEVNSTATDCVDDWSTTAAGAQAIRVKVPGTLAGGESASFSYVASVVDSPAANALACNSVAVVSSSTPVTEPRPVCAIVQEADLEAGGPDTVDVQLDRPSVFPFEFENLGGTAEAPATVTVDIPEGVSVTNLDYEGWTCTADTAAPVDGAAQLTCTPESGLLETGAPMQLNLETVVNTPSVAITATVDGPMFDTDLDNNAHTITAIIDPAATEVAVAKTDGREAVVPGQETTYTISVTNTLLYEPLVDVVIIDTLPEGTEFVSASAGGAHDSDAVTWRLSEIAAGATVDVTVTVLVAEDAPNTITNIVNVSGVDPIDAGNVLTGEATDVNSVNRISLEKTGMVADGTAPQAGDTVTFEFTATNTGGGVLSDVTLTDAMAGLSGITVQSWPALPGYLGVGDSVTATATYTLTQADVDAGMVENSAALTANTVDSDEVADTATVEVPLNSAAELGLEKTGTINGDQIDYAFMITNDGNVTLTGVTLNDPMAGLSAIEYGAWPAAEGTLAPGESVTATASYTITQGDRESGTVANTATVTGLSPQGGDVTGTDTDETVPPVNPGITLVKTGELDTAEPVHAGAGVLYTFEVENTGDITLSGVTIGDQLAGLSAIDYGAWPATDGVLAPGESVTATATYVLTQADVDAGGVINTATATGTPTQGEAPTSSDDDEIVIEAAPAVTLTKEGELGGAGAVGDDVTYTFTVTNGGNVTLTDVAIDDQMEDLSTITFGAWPAAEGTLAPGESVTATATYTLTQADVESGVVENMATVTGLTPAGGEVSDDDSFTVAPPVNPGLSLTKSSTLEEALTASAGDVVEYTFVLENTGDVTLSDVLLEDPLVGLSDIEFGAWPSLPGYLGVGESVTATATYVLTQSDVNAGEVNNTANATGTPTRGDAPTASDEDQVLLGAVPGVAIDKVGTLQGTGVAGDEIEYGFTVENIGNLTLANVTIEDAMAGLSSIEFGAWPAADGTLAPGESVSATATYVLTQADVDAGVVDNTATVTSTAPRGDAPSASDDEQIAINAAAGIAIEKSSAVTGGTVEYTFVVENTGNLTLTDVTIDDAMAGLSDIDFGAWPAAAGTLAPGESVTATATYVLTQADVDAGSVENTATATGTPSRGDAPEASDDDQVTIEAAPAVVLSKSSSLDGAGAVGDEVTYTFVVENTGNLTLTGVVVDDPMPGLSNLAYSEWPAVQGTLAPGESVTATATYVITQTDVDAGGVENTATATGLPARGDAVTATDDDQFPLEGVPGITLSKSSVLDGAGAAGDEVTYTFVVENTGNITLSGVAIDDAMTGLSDIEFGNWPADEGILAPGETVTATATYALTQADIDAGEVNNTATATGTPARGEAPEASDEDQMAIETAPGLTIVKIGELDDANTDEFANPGESISYSFEVSNTGNVTLVNVEVDDAMVTGIPMIETLVPGETVTVAADAYVVTDGDAEAGVVRNTATVTGELPDGSAVISEPSTSEIPAQALPVSPDAGENQQSELGRTGAEYTALVGTAGALTLVGLVILIAVKRRRAGRHEVM